ncbi:MAG: protein kinase [Myxococcota bacterium]
MATLKRIGRTVAVCLGLVLLVVGAFALANALVPAHAIVAMLRDRLLTALMQVPGANLAVYMDPVLEHPGAQYGLVPLGLVLLFLGIRMGRTAKLDPGVSEDADGPREVVTFAVDKKTAKKGLKQAAALAKVGRALDAAELCFANGSMEAAAEYFVKANEFERAAEIRHDQNRFIESAELYLEARNFESAAAVFAQQDEYLRAGEAYEQAGNSSVAAEMFEKAKEFLRAADGYAKSGFPRNAAKAYVVCERWKQAAECLEEAIRDEAAGVMGDANKAAEQRKLVMMAGSLYERAGLCDRAQTVFERGERYGAAAEIALRRGRAEQAADLFLKAKDVLRAAEVLRRIGQGEEAARHLALHFRDRGEDELAAKHFEEAGELQSAGDLYRLLEQYGRAGEVYEKYGDCGQAAEMYALAGDRERAGACFERAGLYGEAAECAALAGDVEREAALLGQAGDFLRAAQIHLDAERTDEAIKALQQVAPSHADFVAASALLGSIFRDRGMLPLAINKLRHATSEQELSRANIDAFYGLATCMETEDPTEATELYEKIMAFDYEYADVAARLEKTREAARVQSASSEVTPLSGSGKAGRYEITGKLGRGGMGIVYSARDTVLDRTVAFKVLPDSLQENPQALKNFLREAKSAAALNHANIVTVYDAGEQDGCYYIAMEYVDGNTLKEIVKHRGKISATGIIHVVSQMAEALAYAHENKIVHRDIKSANAMWTRERKVKIMDFGLARVIEEVRNHTTVVSGTPYYMSPEQTLGKNVDHRTDVYSLGVTIFELATGSLPFTEGNLPYHHVHTPPPDPREFDSEIPELIADMILRCMQKNPADRYQSTREMLVEIKASLNR